MKNVINGHVKSNFAWNKALSQLLFLLNCTATTISFSSSFFCTVSVVLVCHRTMKSFVLGPRTTCCLVVFRNSIVPLDAEKRNHTTVFQSSTPLLKERKMWFETLFLMFWNFYLEIKHVMHNEYIHIWTLVSQLEKSCQLSHLLPALSVSSFSPIQTIATLSLLSPSNCNHIIFGW